MDAFAVAAGLIAVAHLVAGWQRPRPAVIVSGILWLLYAIYEHQVASGVLCDAKCNIRVDLVLLFPILAIATFCAYRSYQGRSGQHKILFAALGIIGLVVLALVIESFGYGVLSSIVLVAALGVGVYAIKSKSATHRASG